MMNDPRSLNSYERCEIGSSWRSFPASHLHSILQNTLICKWQNFGFTPVASTPTRLTTSVTRNAKEHIHAKINKAYMMLGIIKRNFSYLTIATLIFLYNSMVRSHLDYCSPVWAPYRKEDIQALEKVQKRATKIIPALKNLPTVKNWKLARYQPYIIDA